MPIQESLLISCKNNVIEMTATVIDPHLDNPKDLAELLDEVIFNHQYQAMTDPAILNPADLDLGTCFVCREELPTSWRETLLQMNFEPVEEDGGGRNDRSLFSRFQRARRAKLDKWRTHYARPRDASPRLATLEENAIEEVDLEPWHQLWESATKMIARTLQEQWDIQASPSRDGLYQIERSFLEDRAKTKSRFVLHPATVRALTCFVASTIFNEIPHTEWNLEPEADAPLRIRTQGGRVIETDPEFRVVQFITKGNRKLLTDYVDSLAQQTTDL